MCAWGDSRDMRAWSDSRPCVAGPAYMCEIAHSYV